jgi:hypothetical protein
MTDLAMLGIGVDATQVVTGTNALGGLTSAGEKAEKSTQALTVATDLLSQGMKLLGISVSAVALEKFVENSNSLAIKYQQLGLVMNAVGAGANLTAGQMSEVSAALEKNGFSMIDARRSARDLAVAQVDMADASKLGLIATNAAIVGETTRVDALHNITIALETGMARTLRHMGIVVDFTAAEEKMKLQIGATGRELTEQEKITARTSAVIEASAKLDTVKAEASKSVAGQIALLNKNYEDMKTKLGEATIAATSQAFLGLSDAVKAANTALDSDAGKNRIAEIGADLQKATAFAVQNADSVLKIGEAWLAFKGVSIIEGMLVSSAKWVATTYTETAASLQNAIAHNATRTALINEASAKIAALNSDVALLQAEIALNNAKLAGAATDVERIAATRAIVSARTAEVALTRQAVAVEGELAAAEGIATSGATALSSAVAFLGGPVGIISGLLALGAAAWVLWGDDAKDAADKAKDGIDKSKEALESFYRQRELKQAGGSDLQVEYDHTLETIKQLKKELAEMPKEKVAVSTGVAGGVAGGVVYVENPAIAKDKEALDEAYKSLGNLHYAIGLHNADVEKQTAAEEKARATLQVKTKAENDAAITEQNAIANAKQSAEQAKKHLEEETKLIQSAKDKIAVTTIQIKNQDDLNKQVLAGTISYEDEARALIKSSDGDKLREAAMKATSSARKTELLQLAEKADLEAKQKTSVDNTSFILAEQDATKKANEETQKEIDLYYESADAKIIDLAAYKAEIEAKGKDANYIDDIVKKTREQAQETLTLNHVKAMLAATDKRTPDEGESIAHSAINTGLNGNKSNTSALNTSAQGMIGKSTEQKSYEDAKKWLDKHQVEVQKFTDDYNKKYKTTYTASQVTEKAKEQLTQDSLNSQLTNTADFFGQMTSLSSSKNKELQAIGKASAIAQATLNGYVSISEAMKVSPWWLAVTETAIATAMVAANLANIMGMADGGIVSGPGGPTEDKVNARLSNGEFVVNSVAASRNRPILEAMNTNTPTLQTPVYAASGGSVGTAQSSVQGQNISIHNYAGANVSTSTDDTGTLKIMIQSEAKKQAKNVLHSELSNPNSKSRQLLKQGTNVQDRHTA